MTSPEDELAPVLLGLLEEQTLDDYSARLLAMYLAARWSSSPWNEHADLLQRADWALGTQGSSLLEWFGKFPGMPGVICISRDTYDHLQSAYEMLDEHEEEISRRLRYPASQVPISFLTTIEAGLGTGDHRLAGLGALNGLFGLETAYAAEGIYEQSAQVQQTRNRLLDQLSLLPLP